MRGEEKKSTFIREEKDEGENKLRHNMVSDVKMSKFTVGSLIWRTMVIWPPGQMFPLKPRL